MAATKAILVLQGGGALGAYECGVYRALVPHLRARGETLGVVAGTSIGAINASLIASHYGTPDHGVGVLTSFWREVLPARSLGVFPDTGIWRRWNAVWTSLLVGNRHLFTPAAPLWPLVPPVSWASLTRFYDTAAMEQTLRTYFQSYGGSSASEPRLIITAVDVEQGASCAFDSWAAPITPDHVVASGSLPPWLPAKEIDGRVYWDGGLWSNTPLRDVIDALQSPQPNGRQSGEEHTEQEQVAYIVDLFPRGSPLPTTNWEITHRIAAILFGDKTEYDQKFCDAVTHHVEFVRRLDSLVDALPSEVGQQVQKLAQEIQREYRRVEQQRYVPLRIHRIKRSARTGEYVSADIDFSLDRINELLEQGEADTAEQLSHGA